MPRRQTQRIESRALLVRRVPYGDSDVVATLFTERAGLVASMARGARASRRRFSALEPMHELEVVVEHAAGQNLGTLLESCLVRPRLTLTSSLERMDAAGVALRWLADLAAAQVADAAAWAEIGRLLDSLDGGLDGPPLARLGVFGLRLLAISGWAVELGRCVQCGRPCPERATTRLDPAAGGIVCSACGRAPLLLTARERRALVAAADDAPGALDRADDALRAVDIARAAIAAHGRAVSA